MGLVVCSLAKLDEERVDFGSCDVVCVKCLVELSFVELTGLVIPWKNYQRRICLGPLIQIKIERVAICSVVCWAIASTVHGEIPHLVI